MARQKRKPVNRSPKRRKPKFSTRLKRSIGWPWIKNWQHFFKIGFLLAFWSIIVLAIAIFVLSMGLPDIHKAVDMVQSPTIVIRDNKGVEFSRLGDVQGELLKTGDMSPHLIAAVLATEDRRFYSHFGIDPIGLSRAIWSNIRNKGGLQGGSTITQQLAKNLFLTPERTLKRKIKEALLAIYLERRYTKNEILAAYLNRSYFGAGAYGIDSAARVYFKRSARNLELEQAAMLAGLLKAPSRYSPDNDPKLTTQRTRTVLRAMVNGGFLREGADKIDLKPLPKREYNVGGVSDLRYYADWIMSQVDSYTGESKNDLVVDTMMDSELQIYAAKQLRAILDEEGPGKNITQGALIVMQPDGGVVTMVGGKDYSESEYNRATQSLRQPGSSFKPFVYLAALEAGYMPHTLVIDEPLRIGKYAPQNFDGKYRGTLPLRDAVANSLNTVAVRVASDIGIPKVQNVAQRMGITEDLTPDLSLALGASDVHMLSLTSAYATLANNGKAAEPYGIRMIRTKGGKILYQRRETQPLQVLSPIVVSHMNHILQGVITYGTGQRAMIDRPAAGKTGTSSNYRDAWFMGYTTDYATGVWVGNDNNKPMKKVTGGSVPAKIWRDVMIKAEAGKPIRALPASAGIMASDLPLQQDFLPPDHGGSQGGVFDRLLDSLLGNRNPPPPQLQGQGQIEWDN